MKSLSKIVYEILGKIDNSNGPFNATELEEELAKKLKESFEDCYKKAADELDVDPDAPASFAIPSPGIVSGYIEELPEADQANALAIVNDWFDNLED